MMKRAISKNFFHWEPIIGPWVFDQRLVNKYLAENKPPKESALDYRDIETKILVYEDRVKGWFLDVANELKKNNEAGFIILQISLSYIEGNQQYREGKSSRNVSEKFFIRGMSRIFKRRGKNYKKLLKDFYKQVRCGLFHDGMTRRNVTISGEFKKDLLFTKNEIKINPHKFLDTIYEDFENYIKQLKNKKNARLRKSFEDHMNLIG